MIFSA